MPINHDFISLLIQAARASGIKMSVQSYATGATITSLEAQTGDLDRFLLEITNIADQDQLNLRLAIHTTNVHVKNEFQRHGFVMIQPDPLRMERPFQGITHEELQFMESAPPGAKAKRFIKHQKAEFKERYGKRWKQVLYATAWKQFGESRSIRDYLALVERDQSLPLK